MCLKCHNSCKTCNGETENDCIECDSSLYMSTTLHKCITCYVKKGFFIKDGKYCEECHPTCAECNGKSNNNC